MGKEQQARTPSSPLSAGVHHTHRGPWAAAATPRSCSPAFPSGQKATGSPKGLALLGDLPTLRFSEPGRNRRKSREGKWAGERSAPPPATCSTTPELQLHSRTACHVSQPTLTCSSWAPPPPRPRPGPPDPSPCSVCAACLQRLRAPRTARGAPPMIGLPESRSLLQRSRSCPYTQHSPASSRTRSPPRSQVRSEPPCPPKAQPPQPRDSLSSPGSPLAGSGRDFRFQTQRQPGTPPH